MIRLAINGATGRMGRRLVALSRADASFDLVSATCSEKSANLNQDAGELAGIGSIGLVVQSRIEKSPQVVIDFSSPAGAAYAVEYCLTNEIPLMLHHRLLSLRGYDTNAMMIEADVVEGRVLADSISHIFKNASVAYIHIHNARPGCYNCLVKRA